MGKRPKRRIVLFLLEGKSDRDALQLAISELYDQIDENIEVFFPVIRNEEEERGGDITTSRYADKRHKTHWVGPENIEDAIYTLFLEDFFDMEKILPKDIEEIVQIVDTDGAYISDECIELDTSLSDEEPPKYTNTSIKCLNVENMMKRNHQKRENLDYLSSLSKIKVRQRSVTYSVYYFSSNLDHFLHNSPNLDIRLKRDLADVFSRKYIGKAEEFADYISADPAACNCETYDESWSYIRQGCNSLQRHTNINLLLNGLVEQVKNT